MVCRKTTTTEHKNQTHRMQCTCSDPKPFLLNAEKRNHKKRHFTQMLVQGMRHIKPKTTDHCGGREGSSMSKNILHKTIMDFLQRLHHIQHHHMHCPLQVGLLHFIFKITFLSAIPILELQICPSRFTTGLFQIKCLILYCKHTVPTELATKKASWLTTGF